MNSTIKYKGFTARIEFSSEFYLEVCAKDAKKVKKTYSGKLLFRLPSELHAKVAEAALGSGKSINEWGKEVFESAIKA